MYDNSVYLVLRVQNGNNFLRYVRNGGARERHGERPAQTDIPDDRVPDDQCCCPFGVRFDDPIVRLAARGDANPAEEYAGSAIAQRPEGAAFAGLRTKPCGPMLDVHPLGRRQP